MDIASSAGKTEATQIHQMQRCLRQFHQGSQPILHHHIIFALSTPTQNILWPAQDSGAHPDELLKLVVAPTALPPRSKKSAANIGVWGFDPGLGLADYLSLFIPVVPDDTQRQLSLRELMEEGVDDAFVDVLQSMTSARLDSFSGKAEGRKTAGQRLKVALKTPLGDGILSLTVLVTLGVRIPSFVLHLELRTRRVNPDDHKMDRYRKVHKKLLQLN